MDIALSEVCLFPLVVGNDLKMKPDEALAYGRTCVSTPIAVQGVLKI